MLLPLVALALACACVSAAEYSVDTRTGGIVETASGRHVVFHGMNCVEKLAPFLAPLTAADCRLLHDELGLNVVRLGVLWQATFPSGPDTLNATYLADVRATIELLAAHGISTLVDAHQDVLNRRDCGEGVPEWAFEKALANVGFNRSRFGAAFPSPWRGVDLNVTGGVPDLAECQQHEFFQYYLTFESDAAFRGLYGDAEVVAAFAEHWRATAAALHGTKGLLGYELLNEPFPAPVNGALLSDAKVLGALYASLYAAIRSEDASTIVVFEPLVLESYLATVDAGATDFPAGGPGGADDADKQLFGYHSYCPSNADGTPGGMRLLCPTLVEKTWSWVDRSLARLGLGGFLTEFGAVGNDEDSLALLRWQLAGAERRAQSWTYWTFKGFDDITTANAHTETLFYANGTRQLEKMRVLARPYARKVAGSTSVPAAFDDATGNFALDFVTDSSLANCTTELSLPNMVFPNGFDWQVTPAELVTTLTHRGLLLLNTENAPHGTQVSVRVTPK